MSAYRTPIRRSSNSALAWLFLIGLALSLWLAILYIGWQVNPRFDPLWFPPSLVWFVQAANLPAGQAVFRQALLVFTGALLFHIVFGLWLSQQQRRRLADSAKDIHGSAHWATRAELKAMQLIAGTRAAHDGLYIGAWRDPKRGVLYYLRDTTLDHLLVVMPTGGGKDVSIVLPNMLWWPGSVVVHDLKGATYRATAGWRRQSGQKIVRFAPTDCHSDGYNALAEVRLGTEREVADVQNLSTILLDPDGAGLNDFWQKMADGFGTALILYVCYQRLETDGVVASLPDVADRLSDPHEDKESLLQRMQYHPHPVVQMGARDMIDLHERQRSDVIATFLSNLFLYRDPQVRRVTGFSSFALDELRDTDRPVSFYLENLPSDKDRLRPVMRLIVNQISRRLTETLPERGAARTLMLMNEFYSLGRLSIFQESLSFFREYGITAILLVQDLEQLQDHYGRYESISSNCATLVATAPNKPNTAKTLSLMTGETTVQKVRQTVSGRRHGLFRQSISDTIDEVKRNLLTEEEVRRLQSPVKHGTRIVKPGHLLVFRRGEPAILGEQPLYFRDPVFQSRAYGDVKSGQ